MTRLAATFVLGCLVLAVTLFANGQPPAGTSAPPKNALPKNALPEGAIARLGDARFKNFGRTVSLAFSPDSKMLITGSWDGILTCWDLTDREVLSQWEGHTGPINALAISPDSKILASAGQDHEIRIWRTANSEQISALPGTTYKLGFRNLCFSPDGRRLVSDDSRDLMVWDLATEKVRANVTATGYGFRGGAVFQENSTVVYAVSRALQQATTLEYLDERTGKKTKELAIKVLPYGVSGLSARAKWFVAPAFESHELQAVNLTMQADAVRLGALYVVAIAISSDERLVAFADEKRIAVHELATGAVRRQFPRLDSVGACLAISPNGRYLASGSIDRSVILWDLSNIDTSGKKPAIALAGSDLDRLWNDLNSSDGAVVHRAVWQIAAGARDSVPYLRQKLILPPSDGKTIEKLIDDLDDRNFRTRERAANELEKHGYEAVAALRKKLGAEAISLESRRRIERLIELSDGRWNDTRMLRVIEALERSGGPDALTLLQQIARLGGAKLRADEASSALRRLNVEVRATQR